MDPFLENVTLVNNHLEAAGLPSPLIFGSLQQEDVGKVIQCIFSLLNQRQKDAYFREELLEKLRILTNDHKILESTHMKLQVIKDQLEREHCHLLNKQDELQKNLAKTSTQLQQLKEEVKTTRQQLGSLKSYAQVDARKREKEANKLRDQLHKLSQDPKTMKKISFQSKTLLSKPILTKGNVKMEFDQSIIHQLEEKSNQLFEENVLLRQSLEDIYGLLSKVTFEDSATLSPYIKANGKLLGPHVEDFAINVMKEIETKLQELTCNAQKTAIDDKILNQLKEQQEVIDRQMNIIQANMERPKSPSIYHEEWEQLKQREKQLDEERKNFTQAALKIGKERIQLQREMEQFQEEKRLFDNEKILLEEDNPFVEMATFGTPLQSNNNFGTPLQSMENRMPKSALKSKKQDIKKEVTIRTTPSSVRFFNGMNKEN